MCSDKFKSAINYFPNEILSYLNRLDTYSKENIQEIRLRAFKPIMLKISGEIIAAKTLLKNEIILTATDINCIFEKMCDYSFHIKLSEVINGYLILRDGNRAGIVGTCIVDNGKIISIKEITSINIRIANEHIGCSDEIVKRAFGNKICGMLLAGPPASGKTTVLRDIALVLSQEFKGNFYNVSVIDERGEIFGVYRQQTQNKSGANCDILNTYPKAQGMQIALRTLSPDIVICDEIGSDEDVKAVNDNTNSGIITIATAHGSDIESLLRRNNIRQVLKSGAFEKVVFLKSSRLNGAGQIEKIHDISEFYNLL